MKSFIVFALFVAAAVAVPVNPNNPDAEAAILRFDSDNIGTDGFNYAYETSNGIKGEETGSLADAGTENEGIEVRGIYSYPGPDGVVYTVTYTAGRNGFQPSGAHIPQP